MGAAGIKRRKKYQRVRKVTDDVVLDGPWTRTNSPYLIESQIEDYGRFVRGLRHASPGRRAVARAFVILLIFVPLAFGIGSAVYNLAL
ncbi:MAG: hypothetical protein ACT4OX_03475 [Actinomycetota bacterium]